MHLPQIEIFEKIDPKMVNAYYEEWGRDTLFLEQFYQIHLLILIVEYYLILLKFEVILFLLMINKTGII